MRKSTVGSRWRRISLRALLAIIALLALGLAHEVERAREQRALAALVRQVGGDVTYADRLTGETLVVSAGNVMTPADAAPDGPPLERLYMDHGRKLVAVDTSHQFEPPSPEEATQEYLTACESLMPAILQVRSLQALDTTSAYVTDSDLRRLARLRELQQLSICGASVTDDGVAHLAALKRLTVLSLRRTPVTDTVVETLVAMPRLTTVNLSGTDLSDAGLVKLAGMPALRSLDVRSTRVTPEGVKRLRKLAPQCAVRF